MADFPLTWPPVNTHAINPPEDHYYASALWLCGRHPSLVRLVERVPGVITHDDDGSDWFELEALADALAALDAHHAAWDEYRRRTWEPPAAGPGVAGARRVVEPPARGSRGDRRPGRRDGGNDPRPAGHRGRGAGRRAAVAGRATPAGGAAVTMQPIWRTNRPGSSWRAEVGVRVGDELELEVTAPQPFAQTVVVLNRREIAALVDALYEWLRTSPPGRGGVIVTPAEAAELGRALEAAHALVCVRDDCGHPMGHHGVGTLPGRPSPCLSCLCPGFR